MNQHSNTSLPRLPLGQASLEERAHFLSLFKTNLEYLNVGRSVRAVAAPVSFDVLEPLDVRLGITVDLTV